MNDQRPQIIRGTIDGKAKYCRIPVRSKLYETMQEGGELSAEVILAMPHEKAVVVIDAIMADWFYWMRRAGEYFVQLAPQEGAGADQTGGISNGEYLRRVLPGMTDETLRNIFACKATCSDCPMEEPCRNCIDKRHRGEKAPDLTCGDRWELWLKEAVK